MSERHQRVLHLLLALVALALPFAPCRVAVAQDVDGEPFVRQDQGRTLVVGAGQSLVVDTPWRVAHVSITEPVIADIQVLTPQEVLVTGKSLGTTDLILWSDADRMWRVEVVVRVDLTHLHSELQSIFPDAALEVGQYQDVLVVSGQLRRTEEAVQLRSVLDSFDVKYVDKTSIAGVHQVMLKVRMAEVSREAIRSLGANFLYGGSDFFGASLAGPDSGGPLNPISIAPVPGSSATGDVPFIFGDIGVASGINLIAGIPSADLLFFIDALAENQYVRILAEPTLIALSGEEASFLAGGEFPIPVVQGAAGASTSGSSITIEYKEFGVRLAFTPLVLGDGTIRLKVAPEVSEISAFGAVVIEGFEIPSVLARRASTTLELKSGQSFTMAGLLSRSTTARRSAVPLLGDLPVLGALFRSTRYVTGETELVILVTASLVEPSSEVGTPALPGDLHVPPDNWEFYVLGQIEGRRPPLAPVDARWLEEKGLDRLRGPGAWTSYEQRPVLAAEMGPWPSAHEPGALEDGGGAATPSGEDK